MKVVVDCANGAAYRTAPDTLNDLGAEVISLATDPDGFNINEGCGAVHPDVMAAASFPSTLTSELANSKTIRQDLSRSLST